MDTADKMEGFNQYEDPSKLMEMLKLLLTKKDVALKTEIRNPPALATLKTLQKQYALMGWSKSANTLKTYIKYVNIYFVSHGRQSRAEYVDAFKWASTQLIQEKLSFKDGITSDLKD
ncbi:hypothetical protein ES702_06946 [subsurface metagenome]